MIFALIILGKIIAIFIAIIIAIIIAIVMVCKIVDPYEETKCPVCNSECPVCKPDHYTENK